MDIHLIRYTPRLRDVLLNYMQSVYPYRDIHYLEWWLSNINSGEEEDWAKCLLITEGSDIIGCTTAIPIELLWKGVRSKFFFRGNTIISTEKRGLGISKMLYNVVNQYSNWLSVGITDIAWKIQPRYVKNFVPIQPVNIYVAANGWIVPQLVSRLFNNKPHKMEFPPYIKMSRNDVFVRIGSTKELVFPDNLRWTDDTVELVRDEVYIQKRFFDIFCSERYAVYKYVEHEKTNGYTVLRKMMYGGFEMVCVVDYRFQDKCDERKAFLLAQRIARRNRIGLVFGMSSRKYGFIGSPILVKTPKRLNCAVGEKEIDFRDMLVTSADSDLDFVYYS